METNEKIISEAKKRFQQIMEYTTVRPKFVDEAGDQEQPQDAPNADVSADGGMPQGGDPNMEADPNAQAPMDGGADMGGGDAQGPEGFNPQVPDNGEMLQGGGPNMGGDPNAQMPMEGGADMGEEAAPDDEVIDISDLTDSQEETEEDVKHLGKEFQKVFKCLKQFEDLIQSNDDKLKDLKAEIEKRNPTQLEKLNMQTANSYPFSVKPEEYWKGKEATSNYRTGSDNNGVGEPQYTITQNDINGVTDWHNISDSLDDYDIYHQTIKGTMPR